MSGIAGQAPAAPQALVVLVTAPADRAAALGRQLVAEGRAACVNRLPGIHSTYVWQGSIEEAEEVLLVIKTTPAAYPALERRIRELHPYDVPEVLALPVWAGLAPYLDWLQSSVTAA
jgi:periplasmic divalent cation tolerance protein